MKYYIQNQDKETLTIDVDNTDSLYETALHTVGYKLHTNVDDGDVHEYMILEKDTEQCVGTLMEYMYERACFEALSSLGYYCDDEVISFTPAPPDETADEEDEEEYVEATNIVRFPLLGSKFGTDE